MAQEMFRKTALDKLASPERLDVLMEVTSPKGWIALITMGAVLVGVLIWSIFGSIPERIEGEGMLIRGGGLQNINASGDGTLMNLTIQLNDQVTAGQVVGEISQLGSAEEQRVAQQLLEQAQRDHETTAAEEQANIAGVRANIAGVQADMRSAQSQRQGVAADLAVKRDALKRGFIAAGRVQQVERELYALDERINQVKAQINNLSAQITAHQQKIRAKADAVERARLSLQRLTAKEQAIAKVTSAVTGRVTEIQKRIGDRVSAGEVVAVIEPPSATMEPIVYVNSAIGKRILPNMEAQISPTTVRREEYGFMRGEIRAVGDFPVTPEGVQAVVRNESLVKELLGSGSKIEVVAALRPDPNTPSGYEWSSSSGPPFRIEGGTRVTVSVVVDRKAPISYVLPIIRGATGG